MTSAPDQLENFYADLCLQIGHKFSKLHLLRESLTHPSSVNHSGQKKKAAPQYERLEFLGDRVLGLVVAEWLYQLYPDENEGKLAKRHAALVNRDALQVVAAALNLEKYVKLAHGEKVGAERKNLVVLSDALEALIGAVYLDAGLEAAKNFIQKFWQNAAHVDHAPADPKTSLQEWAQGRGLELPSYTVLQHSGPAHAPKFVISVSVKGHAPVEAEGASKREAEKAAAALLFKAVSNPKTKGK